MCVLLIKRYNYDLMIDSLESSITLLETFLNHRLKAAGKNVPVDEKFGGEAVTIYQRTIKQVYGRKHGARIIQLMTEHPLQTLPVIIRRLKAKYTEWKKAQVKRQ